MRRFYIWLPLLGAVLSQFAEWSHLHWAKDRPFWVAYLVAIGFVLFEYLAAVLAERRLLALGMSPVVMYLIFNTAQILTNGLLLKFLFRMDLNRYHVLAYGLLVVCIAVGAYGDMVRARTQK